ncbi:MAG: hypothetical protein ACUZ8N_08205 [Candidatus Scalindua sp.]
MDKYKHLNIQSFSKEPETLINKGRKGNAVNCKTFGIVIANSKKRKTNAE